MLKAIAKAILSIAAAAVSLLCMGPSAAINVIHQLSHASASMPIMAWAYAGYSVLSVLLAGAAPIAIKYLLAHRQWFSAVASAVLFVFCAGHNLSCAISASSFARSETVSARSSTKSLVKETSGQLEEAIAKRAALAVTAKGQTPAMIDAAIKRSQIDPAWGRSKHCGDATKDESLKFCADMAQKEAEKDAATKVDDLDKEIASLRGKAAALPKGGDEGAVDPQAENVVAALSLIGWVTSIHGVGLGMNMWSALTVEVIAFLGPIMVESTVAVIFGLLPLWQTKTSSEHDRPKADAPVRKGDATDVDPESGELITGGRDQQPVLAQSVGMVEEADDAHVEAKSEPSPVAQLPAPEVKDGVPTGNVEEPVQCEVATVPAQMTGDTSKRKRIKASQKDSGNVTMLHPVDIGPGSDVRAFVRETVTGKTMLRSDVHKAAAGRFNEKAIDRAAKALGVIVTKPDPTKKPVAWSLPAIAIKRVPSIRG